jgi:D-threo-aldose 1-dehydrogenase
LLDVIQIHPDDNVCVAARPLAAGTDIVCGDVNFKLAERCPLGSKLALKPLKSGDKVIKFGEPIGSVTADVGLGGYIHTHNLESDYLHTYERGDLIDG